MADSNNGLSETAVVRIAILVVLGLIAIAFKWQSFYGAGTVYDEPSQQLAANRREAERRGAERAQEKMNQIFTGLDNSRETPAPDPIREAPDRPLATSTQASSGHELARIRELLIDGELPAILPALRDGTFSRNRSATEQREFADQLMTCASYSQLRVALENELLHGTDAQLWGELGKRFLDGSFAYSSSANLDMSDYFYKRASAKVQDEFSGLVERQDESGTINFLRGNDNFCLLTYAIIAGASN